MNQGKPMSLMVACWDFFKIPGKDTIGSFKAEVAKLTPADRKEFKAGLEKNGYVIEGE